MPVMPRNCSWCGHLPHAGRCPGHIDYGTHKNPDRRDCPCAKRSQQ